MRLFRDVEGTEEEVEFRKWARDNYTPFSEIKGIWHPIVQDECVKINKEADDTPGVLENQIILGIHKHKQQQTKLEEN